MNSAIAVSMTALFGVFYCWTSRINGLFFFGRTVVYVVGVLFFLPHHR